MGNTINKKVEELRRVYTLNSVLQMMKIKENKDFMKPCLGAKNIKSHSDKTINLSKPYLGGRDESLRSRLRYWMRPELMTGRDESIRKDERVWCGVAYLTPESKAREKTRKHYRLNYREITESLRAYRNMEVSTRDRIIPRTKRPYALCRPGKTPSHYKGAMKGNGLGEPMNPEIRSEKTKKHTLGKITLNTSETGLVLIKGKDNKNWRFNSIIDIVEYKLTISLGIYMVQRSLQGEEVNLSYDTGYTETWVRQALMKGSRLIQNISLGEGDNRHYSRQGLINISDIFTNCLLIRNGRNWVEAGRDPHGPNTGWIRRDSFRKKGEKNRRLMIKKREDRVRINETQLTSRHPWLKKVRGAPGTCSDLRVIRGIAGICRARLESASPPGMNTINIIEMIKGHIPKEISRRGQIPIGTKITSEIKSSNIMIGTRHAWCQNPCDNKMLILQPPRGIVDLMSPAALLTLPEATNTIMHIVCDITQLPAKIQTVKSRDAGCLTKSTCTSKNSPTIKGDQVKGPYEITLLPGELRCRDLLKYSRQGKSEFPNSMNPDILDIKGHEMGWHKILKGPDTRANKNWHLCSAANGRRQATPSNLSANQNSIESSIPVDRKVKGIVGGSCSIEPAGRVENHMIRRGDPVKVNKTKIGINTISSQKIRHVGHPYIGKLMVILRHNDHKVGECLILKFSNSTVRNRSSCHMNVITRGNTNIIPGTRIVYLINGAVIGKKKASRARWQISGHKQSQIGHDGYRAYRRLRRMPDLVERQAKAAYGPIRHNLVAISVLGMRGILKDTHSLDSSKLAGWLRDLIGWSRRGNQSLNGRRRGRGRALRTRIPGRSTGAPVRTSLYEGGPWRRHWDRADFLRNGGPWARDGSSSLIPSRNMGRNRIYKSRSRSNISDCNFGRSTGSRDLSWGKRPSRGNIRTLDRTERTPSGMNAGGRKIRYGTRDNKVIRPKGGTREVWRLNTGVTRRGLQMTKWNWLTANRSRGTSRSNIHARLSKINFYSLRQGSLGPPWYKGDPHSLLRRNKVNPRRGKSRGTKPVRIRGHNTGNRAITNKTHLRRNKVLDGQGFGSYTSQTPLKLHLATSSNVMKRKGRQHLPTIGIKIRCKYSIKGLQIPADRRINLQTASRVAKHRYSSDQSLAKWSNSNVVRHNNLQRWARQMSEGENNTPDEILRGVTGNRVLQLSGGKKRYSIDEGRDNIDHREKTPLEIQVDGNNLEMAELTPSGMITAGNYINMRQKSMGSSEVDKNSNIDMSWRYEHRYNERYMIKRSLGVGYEGTKGRHVGFSVSIPAEHKRLLYLNKRQTNVIQTLNKITTEIPHELLLRNAWRKTRRGHEGLPGTHWCDIGHPIDSIEIKLRKVTSTFKTNSSCTGSEGTPHSLINDRCRTRSKIEKSLANKIGKPGQYETLAKIPGIKDLAIMRISIAGGSETKMAQLGKGFYESGASEKIRTLPENPIPGKRMGRLPTKKAGSLRVENKGLHQSSLMIQQEYVKSQRARFKRILMIGKYKRQNMITSALRKNILEEFRRYTISIIRTVWQPIASKKSLCITTGIKVKNEGCIIIPMLQKVVIKNENIVNNRDRLGGKRDNKMINTDSMAELLLLLDMDREKDTYHDNRSVKTLGKVKCYKECNGNNNCNNDGYEDKYKKCSNNKEIDEDARSDGCANGSRDRQAREATDKRAVAEGAGGQRATNDDATEILRQKIESVRASVKGDQSSRKQQTMRAATVQHTRLIRNQIRMSRTKRSNNVETTGISLELGIGPRRRLNIRTGIGTKQDPELGKNTEPGINLKLRKVTSVGIGIATKLDPGKKAGLARGMNPHSRIIPGTKVKAEKRKFSEVKIKNRNNHLLLTKVDEKMTVLNIDRTSRPRRGMPTNIVLYITGIRDQMLASSTKAAIRGMSDTRGPDVENGRASGIQEGKVFLPTANGGSIMKHNRKSHIKAGLVQIPRREGKTSRENKFPDIFRVHGDQIIQEKSDDGKFHETPMGTTKLERHKSNLQKCNPPKREYASIIIGEVWKHTTIFTTNELYVWRSYSGSGSPLANNTWLRVRENDCVLRVSIVNGETRLGNINNNILREFGRYIFHGVGTDTKTRLEGRALTPKNKRRIVKAHLSDENTNILKAIRQITQRPKVTRLIGKLAVSKHKRTMRKALKQRGYSSVLVKFHEGCRQFKNIHMPMTSERKEGVIPTNRGRDLCIRNGSATSARSKNRLYNIGKLNIDIERKICDEYEGTMVECFIVMRPNETRPSGISTYCMVVAILIGRSIAIPGHRDLSRTLPKKGISCGSIVLFFIIVTAIGLGGTGAVFILGMVIIAVIIALSAIVDIALIGVYTVDILVIIDLVAVGFCDRDRDIIELFPIIMMLAPGIRRRARGGSTWRDETPRDRIYANVGERVGNYEETIRKGVVRTKREAELKIGKKKIRLLTCNMNSSRRSNCGRPNFWASGGGFLELIPGYGGLSALIKIHTGSEWDGSSAGGTVVIRITGIRSSGCEVVNRPNTTYRITGIHGRDNLVPAAKSEQVIEAWADCEMTIINKERDIDTRKIEKYKGLTLTVILIEWIPGNTRSRANISDWHEGKLIIPKTKGGTGKTLCLITKNINSCYMIIIEGLIQHPDGSLNRVWERAQENMAAGNPLIHGQSGATITCKEIVLILKPTRMNVTRWHTLKVVPGFIESIRDILTYEKYAVDKTKALVDSGLINGRESTLEMTDNEAGIITQESTGLRAIARPVPARKIKGVGKLARPDNQGAKRVNTIRNGSVEVLRVAEIVKQARDSCSNLKLLRENGQPSLLIRGHNSITRINTKGKGIKRSKNGAIRNIKVTTARRLASMIKISTGEEGGALTPSEGEGGSYTRMDIRHTDICQAMIILGSTDRKTSGKINMIRFNRGKQLKGSTSRTVTLITRWNRNRRSEHMAWIRESQGWRIIRQDLKGTSSLRSRDKKGEESPGCIIGVRNSIGREGEISDAKIRYNPSTRFYTYNRDKKEKIVVDRDRRIGKVSLKLGIQRVKKAMALIKDKYSLQLTLRFHGWMRRTNTNVLRITDLRCRYGCGIHCNRCGGSSRWGSMGIYSRILRYIRKRLRSLRDTFANSRDAPPGGGLHARSRGNRALHNINSSRRRNIRIRSLIRGRDGRFLLIPFLLLILVLRRAGVQFPRSSRALIYRGADIRGALALLSIGKQRVTSRVLRNRLQKSEGRGQNYRRTTLDIYNLDIVTRRSYASLNRRDGNLIPGNIIMRHQGPDLIFIVYPAYIEIGSSKQILMSNAICVAGIVIGSTVTTLMIGEATLIGRGKDLNIPNDSSIMGGLLPTLGQTSIHGKVHNYTILMRWARDGRRLRLRNSRLNEGIRHTTYVSRESIYGRTRNKGLPNSYQTSDRTDINSEPSRRDRYKCAKACEMQLLYLSLKGATRKGQGTGKRMMIQWWPRDTGYNPSRVRSKVMSEIPREFTRDCNFQRWGWHESYEYKSTHGKIHGQVRHAQKTHAQNAHEHRDKRTSRDSNRSLRGRWQIRETRDRPTTKNVTWQVQNYKDERPSRDNEQLKPRDGRLRGIENEAMNKKRAWQTRVCRDGRTSRDRNQLKSKDRTQGHITGGMTKGRDWHTRRRKCWQAARINQGLSMINTENEDSQLETTRALGHSNPLNNICQNEY